MWLKSLNWAFLKKVALVMLAKRFDGHDSTIEFFDIKSDMTDHGFSAEEVTVALGMLVNKEMILSVRGENDSGYTTSRYGITAAGIEWLSSHRDKLRPTEEDIPF